MGADLATREDVIRKELEEFKVLGKRKTKARHNHALYHKGALRGEKKLKVDYIDVAPIKI